MGIIFESLKNTLELEYLYIYLENHHMAFRIPFGANALLGAIPALSTWKIG